MKKAFALLLTIALIATLAVASFADTATFQGGSSKEYGVEYEQSDSSVEIFSVDIAWTNDDLTFAYNAGTEGEWDPKTHTYGAATDAGWVDNDLEVTVSNHSNANVIATISIADVANDGVTVAVEGDNWAELTSAVGTTVEEAPAVVFVVTASGTPKAGAKVASATIFITKPAEAEQE